MVGSPALGNKNAEIYVMGDFNINFLDQKNLNTKDIISTMKTFGFNPLINEFTRYCQDPIFIDQIFSNSNYIAQSGILYLNLSDHAAICRILIPNFTMYYVLIL